MKIAGFLLAAVGGLIVLLSAWYAYEATRFFAGSTSATGVIVEHKLTGGLNTGRRETGFETQTQVTDMYAPVVKFETPDGSIVRFQASWSEGEPPAVGTEVGVRFPKDRPEEARVAGISSLYGGAGILLLIGAVFLGAGLLVLRKGKAKAA